MNTVLLGIIGIVLLIAFSWILTSWDYARNTKASKRLAELRKSFALKSDWLLKEKNKVNASVFRRTAKYQG